MNHRYVAFLRGINLGRRRLKMSQLQELFEELGFAGVETFIASGNVIFNTSRLDVAKLEERIELHLAKSLGYPVETHVRSGPEIAAVLDFRPFPKENLDENTLHIAFVREPVSRQDAQKLIACRTPHDEFCVKGRELYWLCRIRTSESKVWTSPQMKAIRFPAMTMRNISTIEKLATKHALIKGGKADAP